MSAPPWGSQRTSAQHCRKSKAPRTARYSAHSVRNGWAGEGRGWRRRRRRPARRGRGARRPQARVGLSLRVAGCACRFAHPTSQASLEGFSAGRWGISLQRRGALLSAAQHQPPGPWTRRAPGGSSATPAPMAYTALEYCSSRAAGPATAGVGRQEQGLLRAQLQALLLLSLSPCCAFVAKAPSACHHLLGRGGRPAAPLSRYTGPAPKPRPPAPHLKPSQQLFQDRFPALLLHYHSQLNGLRTAYGLQGLEHIHLSKGSVSRLQVLEHSESFEC